MRALEVSKRLSHALFTCNSCGRRTITSLHQSPYTSHLLSSSLLSSPDFHRNRVSDGSGNTWLLHSPWSATQYRGVKVNAIQVRPGNVIEKAGRIYQVVEVEHKQRGRGGASMQMELRDVDTGNKTSLRFGTEESVEKVFVQEKSFTCLYTEQETAFVIEPDTFEQLEVPLELFGKAAAYLKDGMKVQLQLYDGRPLSGSIPKRVTCTIKEIYANKLGPTVTPRYQRAVLDNGLSMQVPSYLEIGEEIFINTEDDTYISRAK